MGIVHAPIMLTATECIFTERQVALSQGQDKYNSDSDWAVVLQLKLQKEACVHPNQDKSV